MISSIITISFGKKEDALFKKKKKEKKRKEDAFL
jgi:hypothetical protein